MGSAFKASPPVICASAPGIVGRWRAKAHTSSVPIGVQSAPTTMTETVFQPTIEATHNGRAPLEADPHQAFALGLPHLNLAQFRNGLLGTEPLPFGHLRLLWSRSSF